MIVVALITYLVAVGLDKADKLAGGIGAVIALLALGAPYLLPLPASPDADRVENSGAARATGGGEANTGLQSTDDGRPGVVSGSGDAVADGPGSRANTGIHRT